MAYKIKCKDCSCFIFGDNNPSRFGKSIKLGYCHCHGYSCLADDEACSDFTKEDVV